MTLSKSIKTVLGATLIGFSMICLSACHHVKNGEKVKSSKVDVFSFIYDIDCIDLEALPRVDTSFFLPLFFPRDSSIQMLFVSDGNCSTCLSNLMSFIKDYEESLHQGSSSVTTVLESGSRDLFDYYFEKTFDSVRVDSVLSSLNIRIKYGIYDYSPPKGAYLIVNQRIVRYDPWQTLF